jgi:phosphoribosylamine--glycine ligase
VFHAGTRAEGDRVLTNGGRVLGVTALGTDTGAAIESAYSAVGKIEWDGIHYRKDIGRKAV